MTQITNHEGKGVKTRVLSIKTIEQLEEEWAACGGLYPGHQAIEPVIRLLWETAWAQSKITKGDSAAILPQELTKMTESLCQRIGLLCPDHAPRLEELQARIACTLADLNEEMSPDGLLAVYRELCSQIEEQDFLTLVFTISAATLFQNSHAYQDSILASSNEVKEGNGCPVCSQKPHYALHDAEDGSKQLECWMCSTRWKYPRLKCPFCESTDPEVLGYFTLEGMDACRVYYCSACKSYHKVFDLRQHQCGAPSLVLHNLASLICDSVAHREGFHPGSGLNWAEPLESLNPHNQD